MVNIKQISPDDGHYFFGYYDLNAYSRDGRYHLCNKSEFVDKIPQKDDVLELGVIDLKTSEYRCFAKTTAWNFQQGALLQWHGSKDGVVFYNIRQNDEYYSVEHNINTGEKHKFPVCASISADGTKGLGINFDRIFDFRPGYGYSGRRDKFFDQNSPEEDGIFLVDIQKGEQKLIIDYARIKKEFPMENMQNAKFLVNHITFNPDGNRFLFLLRNFATGDCPGWSTSLITSDLDGNMKMLLKNTFVSHYYWKNNDEIVAYCTPYDKAGLFLVSDKTGGATEFKSEYFNSELDDIHCIYSPDKKYIIGDGYPHREDYRTLYVYNTQTGKTDIILKDYTPKVNNWDARCDLHAKFNRQQTKISFDSTAKGKRTIMEIDFCEK